MTDQQNNSEHEKRREASAKFVIQNIETDSSLDLRDAMETAHRSLADSLRLSFRALQFVMIILVVLYLISGFRTVEDSQTGVSTFFGAIVENEGLSPGLQLNWPPPIGGFEIYQAQNRESDIGGVFKPLVDARLSPDQRISKARASDGLIPGRDGSLLTGDGDLAHIEVEAEWEIIDPIQYAIKLPDDFGDEIVTAVLENSMVHIVSQLTLEDLLDRPIEELRSLIQIEAQRSITELNCGIRISDVSIPSEPEPPLYIQRSYEAFDSARIIAETNVERATSEAHETLIEAAGSKYDVLLDLINKYEHAAETKNETVKLNSLTQITSMLHADDISGKVAKRIAAAQGYRAQIETTLGQDFKRFQSLLPTYREHPELVIRSRWLEMYAAVLGNADAETFFVPEFVQSFKLGISGSDSIAQLRHRNDLKLKEAETLLEGVMLNPWILRAREIDLEGPSRELSISSGVVQGRQK
jgi:regulator of protease activity HflC (stomatin/prohibitin superfamily)